MYEQNFSAPNTTTKNSRSMFAQCVSVSMRLLDAKEIMRSVLGCCGLIWTNAALRALRLAST